MLNVIERRQVPQLKALYLRHWRHSQYAQFRRRASGDSGNRPHVLLPTRPWSAERVIGHASLGVGSGVAKPPVLRIEDLVKAVVARRDVG